MFGLLPTERMSCIKVLKEWKNLTTLTYENVLEINKLHELGYIKRTAIREYVLTYKGVWIIFLLSKNRIAYKKVIEPDWNRNAVST